jgi:hypothetical protein
VVCSAALELSLVAVVAAALSDLAGLGDGRGVVRRVGGLAAVFLFVSLRARVVSGGAGVAAGAGVGVLVSGVVFAVSLAATAAVSAVALLSVDAAPDRRSPPQATPNRRSSAPAMRECSPVWRARDRRFCQPEFIAAYPFLVEAPERPGRPPKIVAPGRLLGDAGHAVGVRLTLTAGGIIIIAWKRMNRKL